MERKVSGTRATRSAWLLVAIVCACDAGAESEAASSDTWLGDAGVAASAEALSGSAPVATDDRVHTIPGRAITVDVLANDRDPDGDALTIAAYVVPVNGTVSVSADHRRLTFTPRAGFSGVDSFGYSVTDGRGGSDNADVFVTVSPNRAPVAVADAASVRPATNVTIPVLANDRDPDGDPIRLTSFTVPVNGTVRASADQRSIIYTSRSGFHGVDEIRYTIADSFGGTASAFANVTVNRSPLARADRASVRAGRAVTIPILANDSDPDGDAIRLLSLTGPTQGTIAPASGDRSAVYTAPFSWTGTATFEYEIADRYGARARAEVTVTVSR